MLHMAEDNREHIVFRQWDKHTAGHIEGVPFSPAGEDAGLWLKDLVVVFYPGHCNLMCISIGCLCQAQTAAGDLPSG